MRHILRMTIVLFSVVPVAHATNIATLDWPNLHFSTTGTLVYYVEGATQQDGTFLQQDGVAISDNGRLSARADVGYAEADTSETFWFYTEGEGDLIITGRYHLEGTGSVAMGIGPGNSYGSFVRTPGDGVLTITEPSSNLWWGPLTYLYADVSAGTRTVPEPGSGWLLLLAVPLVLALSRRGSL